MRKLSIITVPVITTTLFITGCGGSSAPKSTEQPLQVVTPPTSNVSPTGNVVSLVGQKGLSQVSLQKMKGETKPQKAIVDAQFSNATGELLFKETNTNITGNLTFKINVDEPDQITDIAIFLPNVQKTISLCDTSCGTNYTKTFTGFNPQLSGELAGDLRIELFVTDSAQNTAMLDALTVTWQPIRISAINATRENGAINVNWEGESSLGRYNIYAATEPNITPENALSLENGTQQLAIKTDHVEISDLDPAKNYYVLITGINENGESGLGAPIKINSELVIENQPPRAVTDEITVNEDSNITSNVLTNDVDPENRTITLTNIISQPSHGALQSQSNGEITYIPTENFVGKDTFSYEIIDDENQTSQASVAITVNNVNDAPIASNDSFNLEIDNTLTAPQGALIANDFDIDGDFLFVDITPITLPLHGTLQLNPDGSFIYTDTGTFVSNDSFQYQVTDNNGGTSIAQVTLLQSGQDTVPVAVNDDYDVDEDSTLNVILANSVLSNDTDPNDLALTLNSTLIKTTSNGQLNIAADGTFTYIPNANFNGIDDFQYEIENTLGETSQAFVTINVNPVADVPTANNDSFQTNEDTSLTVTAITGLLANDADTDGGTLTVNQSPVVAPQQGQLTLETDGSFTYIPNSNFHGVDTFTYQLINNKGNTSSAQATITISSVNDTPQAVNDSSTALSDTPQIINVITNDIDIDGDNLTITAQSTDASFGTVTVQSNQLLYTPLTTFGGIATIDYTVSDPSGETSNATVTVSVSLVGSSNIAPTATDDAYATNEDTTLNGTTLLANDTDADGGTLSVLITPVTNVNNGTLTIATDGTFTYVPNNNFNGADSFSYTLTDGQGGFATAQVNLTVNTQNDLPVAVNDTYSTLENTPLTVIASDFNALLMNDSDEDADTLVVNLAASTNPTSGTLTLDTDGEFTYTPNAGFDGTDSFNYQVEDGNGGSVTGIATITVINVNAAPQAITDNYNIIEGNVLSGVSVLDNDTDADGDTLTVDTTFVSSPSNGTVTLSADGSLEYTPNASYFGADSFTYKADDGNGDQDEGRVNITISPDPAAHGNPFASNDNFTIDEDTTLFDSTLLDNDRADQIDINDTTELTVTTTPIEAVTNGVLILQSNGTFTYTPNENYNGIDSFEYEITNIYGNTSTARVNITITAVDDAPNAEDDYFEIEKNSGKYSETAILLANDSDPENGHLEINETPVVDVLHGVLKLNRHGDIEYTPDTDFVGTDTFIYELEDNAGNTDLATVTITVVDTPTSSVGNLPPVAVDDTLTVLKNSGKTTTDDNYLLDNDSDPEGGHLDINETPVVDVTNGTLTLHKHGKVEYTPDTDFVGTDSFTYELIDDNDHTSTAVVTIYVNEENNG